jgi:leucyl aminopeptidase
MPPITFVASRDVPLDASVLAVPVFAGLAVADGAPVELDLAYLERIGFEAKPGQAQMLPADDGSVVVAVGMGERERADAETFRKAGAAVADTAGRFADVAVALPGADVDSARALAEGVALAAYRFSSYKSDPKPCRIERVTVVAGGGSRLQAALDRAAVVASAVALARDLVNEPAGSLTPARLAEVASEVGKGAGVQVRVLDEKALARERMGALLGVGSGSTQPPRLVEMAYEPEVARPQGHVALVGKGITFDSGGLSIKSADGMVTMKTDMSGGAAVIAVLQAVVLVVATSEKDISSVARRPAPRGSSEALSVTPMPAATSDEKAMAVQPPSSGPLAEISPEAVIRSPR